MQGLADERSAAAARARPTRRELQRQIEELVRTTCGLDGLRLMERRPLSQYGVDSVRAVELLVAFEETFGIEIPDDEAYQLRTIADVVDYLERKQNF